MNSFQQFLLVLFILAITSCTFGDGPELIAPESSDANALTDANELADGTPSTETNTTVDEIAPVQEAEVDETAVVQEADVGELSDNANNITANMQVVRIPRTDAANAPIIDGDTVNYIPNTEFLDGEWRFAAQVNGLGEPLTIGRLMFGTPLSNDDAGHHHWAAMHDGVYLYLLIVSDDAGVHFQDTDELRKPWKDDSVEIYFDGNNSRLEQYDGVDDFHLTVNLQASNGVANRHDHADAKLRQSEASATLPSDLNFATGLRKGPVSSNLSRGRADIYELRIKLSELNIQIDSPFGIELQINDDDDGGTRDRKWAWSHPEGGSSDNDYTWQNPSYMAGAILVR